MSPRVLLTSSGLGWSGLNLLTLSVVSLKVGLGLAGSEWPQLGSLGSVTQGLLSSSKLACTHSQEVAMAQYKESYRCLFALLRARCKICISAPL